MMLGSNVGSIISANLDTSPVLAMALSWPPISFEFQKLAVILLSILCSASAISLILRWRFHRQNSPVGSSTEQTEQTEHTEHTDAQKIAKLAKDAKLNTLNNLNARINAWWVMVAVLFLCVILGKMGVVILFAIISTVCLREYARILDKPPGEHILVMILLFSTIPAQYYLVAIDWYGLSMILIPVYGFIIVSIFEIFSIGANKFLERTAKLQWGLMICVFFISHVAMLTNLKIHGFTSQAQSIQMLAFLILVVQGCDVLQYIWGKLIGRHPLAPTLSPNKTWEGLIGGIISACALAVACRWLTPFTVGESILMAFIICVAGFLGGLAMSAIKRDHNVKDWGNLIEGHGGMLDRLDSIIFSAPLFFHLVRYFWTS